MSLVPYLKYLMIETGLGAGKPKQHTLVFGDDKKTIVGHTYGPGGVEMDKNSHTLLTSLFQDFNLHKEALFKEFPNDWVVAQAELIDEISSTGKIPTVEIKDLNTRRGGRMAFTPFDLDLDEDDFDDDDDDEEEYIDQPSSSSDDEDDEKEKKKAVSKPIPKAGGGGGGKKAPAPRVQKKTQAKKADESGNGSGSVKQDTKDKEGEKEPVVEKPVAKRGGGRKKKEPLTKEEAPVDTTAPVDIASTSS